MRKGNVRILFLMLLILAGLTLLFMMTLKSGNQAEKVAQAAQQEEGVQLTQMETQDRAMTQDRQQFSQNLSEFNKTISTLGQGDMARFKTQSRDAFMQLADLIDQYKGMPGTTTGGAAGTAEADRTPGETPDTAEEGMGAPRTEQALTEGDTDNIRESARRIANVTNEDQIVNELKSAFNASRESMEELQPENNDNAGQQDRFEQIIEDSEDDINQINKQNYKTKTKEIFTDFHEALNYMNTQHQAEAQERRS